MYPELESPARRRWHLLIGAIVCGVIYALTVWVVRSWLF
jgi:hypothetical protein